MRKIKIISLSFIFLASLGTTPLTAGVVMSGSNELDEFYNTLYDAFVALNAGPSQDGKSITITFSSSGSRQGDNVSLLDKGWQSLTIEGESNTLWAEDQFTTWGALSRTVNAIELSGVNNVTVRNLSVEHSRGVGLKIESCSNINFTSCHFKVVSRRGAIAGDPKDGNSIFVSNSSDITFINVMTNVFDGEKGYGLLMENCSSVDISYCTFWKSLENTTVTLNNVAGATLTNVAVDGHGRESLYVSSGSSNIYINGGSYVNGRNNTIELNGVNIASLANVTASGSAGDALKLTNGTSNVTVTGGTFTANGNRSAISLVGSDSNKITGFACIGATLRGTSNTGATYYLDYTDDTTLDNCSLRMGGSKGIHLYRGNSNVIVRNSDITNDDGAVASDPILIEEAAVDVTIENNEIYNLLSGDRFRNVIWCFDNGSRNLTIHNNSFYQSTSITLPSDISTFISVGVTESRNNYQEGTTVSGLTITDNYFGSTASKFAGGAIYFGQSSQGAFICVRASTSNTGSESDIVSGNVFGKIILESSLSKEPNGLSPYTTLTAYCNYNSCFPIIENNVVERMTIYSRGFGTSAFLGFGHGGSEPTFRNNIIRTSNGNVNGSGKTSIYGIFVGGESVSADKKPIVFEDNQFEQLDIVSLTTNSGSVVLVGIWDEAPTTNIYINNTINKLTCANNNYENFLAGIYSASNGEFRKVFEQNRISNLTLTSTSGATDGLASGIYVGNVSSVRIADNIIDSIDIKDGTLYGIYVNNSTVGDTIVNNTIRELHTRGSRNQDKNHNNQNFNNIAILAESATPKEITKNDIYFISNESPVFNGKIGAISVRGDGNTTISQNFISRMACADDHGDVIGIHMMTSAGVDDLQQAKVYNNIVAFNNQNNAKGIMNISGSPRYIHNTVWIKSTNEFSDAIHFVSGKVNMINNIFDNRGAGYAFKHNDATASNFNSTYLTESTKNNFYTSEHPGTECAFGTVGEFNLNPFDATAGYLTGESVRVLYNEPDVGMSEDIRGFQTLNTCYLKGVATDVKVDIVENPRNEEPAKGAWAFPVILSMNNTIYVNRNVNSIAKGYVKDGSSWYNAMPQLSTALRWIRANEDCLYEEGNPLKVYVATGEYMPLFNAENNDYTTVDDRSKSFVLPKNVQLYGGFDPQNGVTTLEHERKFGNTPATGSVLNGDIGTIGYDADNVHNVVIAAGDVGISSMDGFTVQGGYSNENAPVLIDVRNQLVRVRDGAGINITNGNAIELKNMIIQNNTSNDFGGGICVRESSGFIMSGADISNNTSFRGGGVVLFSAADFTVNDVEIKENTARTIGSGAFTILSKGIFENISVEDNTSAGVGALITAYDIESGLKDLGLIVKVQNSKITGNTGGGIITSGITTILTNVESSRNTNGAGILSRRGEGIYTNILVHNNNDGGINATDGSEIYITNATIAQNTATITGNGVYQDETGVVFLRNSIVNGEVSAGVVTVNTDVNNDISYFKFRNPTAGDFRLHVGSPALAAGDVLFYTGATPDISAISEDLAGNPRFSANGESIDMGAYQHKFNLWTGTVDTNWAVPGNWSRNAVPEVGEDLGFVPAAVNDLVIKENESYSVAAVYNHSDKGIIIDPGAALTITGSDVDVKTNNQLLIRAAADKPNGSFITAPGTPVEAQVQMYTKAVSDNAATTMSQLVWQYVGTPVDNYPASGMGGYFVMRSHNEHLNSRWQTIQNEDNLSVFKGYEISRQPKKNDVGIATFTGQLVNTDKTIPLSYTSSVTHEFKGEHIIGNPYTAALNIENGLTFSPEMDATVYFYHTGSRADWLANSGNGNGEAAGQYYAIPQSNASVMGYDRIPSMQGFMVKTKGTTSGSVTFNYKEGTTINNQAMRVGGTQNNKKTFTTIDLTNEEGVLLDKMWLFVNENATRRFDNGYDGQKIFGASTLAHIYSPEEDGNYQVNTVPDISNTYLSFKAEEGISNYVLTFNHINTEDSGTVYLIDLENNMVTNISESGAQYAFTASNDAVSKKRFKLLAERQITDNNTVTEGFYLYQEDGKLFICNKNNEWITMSVYDTMGRLQTTTPLNNNEHILVSTPTTTGVYVVAIVSETTGRTTSEKIIVKQ